MAEIILEEMEKICPNVLFVSLEGVQEEKREHFDTSVQEKMSALEDITD